MEKAHAPKPKYPVIENGISKNSIIIFVVIFVFTGFIALAGYVGYSFFKNLDLPAECIVGGQKKVSDYVTEFRAEIPSSCGYLIGQPTTITNIPESKSWIYEERFVAAESFRDLAPDFITSQGVLLTAMSFKGSQNSWTVSDTNKSEYKYGFTGLVSYCVNNSNKWSLDDFVANVEKISTDELSYTVTGDREVWGDFTLQPISVKGIFKGSYIDEPFLLGVSSSDTNFSRLVIFQPWGASDVRLETDRVAVNDSLKNRSMTSVLSNDQVVTKANVNSSVTTTTSPSCTRYKIYEGEFTSDKCYQPEDLKDLQYYISQYNSAIFSMNGAASSSKITCNGSEFFEDSCKEDKKEYEDSKNDKEKYESTIKEILSKGK